MQLGTVEKEIVLAILKKVRRGWIRGFCPVLLLQLDKKKQIKEISFILLLWNKKNVGLQNRCTEPGWGGLQQESNTKLFFIEEAEALKGFMEGKDSWAY